MRRTGVAIVLLVAGLRAFAGEPRSVDDSPAAAPTDQAALLGIAKGIILKAPARSVQSVTVVLGKPTLRFSWCNRAGCVDDVPESRATRMTAYWEVESSTATTMLAVSFCGGVGEWLVGSVAVKEFPKAHDAWGTAAKSTPLFKNTDEEFFFGTCWVRR
jgi:hypothetical protein